MEDILPLGTERHEMEHREILILKQFREKSNHEILMNASKKKDFPI